MCIVQRATRVRFRRDVFVCIFFLYFFPHCSFRENRRRTIITRNGFIQSCQLHDTIIILHNFSVCHNYYYYNVRFTNNIT